MQLGMSLKSEAMHTFHKQQLCLYYLGQKYIETYTIETFNNYSSDCKNESNTL